MPSPGIIKGFFLNMFLIPRQYEDKIKLVSCKESYQIGSSLFAPRAGEIYSSDTSSMIMLSADSGAIALRLSIWNGRWHACFVGAL